MGLILETNFGNILCIKVRLVVPNFKDLDALKVIVVPKEFVLCLLSCTGRIKKLHFKVSTKDCILKSVLKTLKLSHYKTVFRISPSFYVFKMGK